MDRELFHRNPNLGLYSTFECFQFAYSSLCCASFFIVQVNLFTSFNWVKQSSTSKFPYAAKRPKNKEYATFFKKNSAILIVILYINYSSTLSWEVKDKDNVISWRREVVAGVNSCDNWVKRKYLVRAGPLAKSIQSILTVAPSTTAEAFFDFSLQESDGVPKNCQNPLYFTVNCSYTGLVGWD